MTWYLILKSEPCSCVKVGLQPIITDVKALPQTQKTCISEILKNPASFLP